MNHVNNFPEHLVFMVHTAPGQGRVLCVDSSHPECWVPAGEGVYVVDEWDNTKQIREDFNADQ
jgi:hypothetical protein